jgi:hypothetical protein
VKSHPGLRSTSAHCGEIGLVYQTELKENEMNRLRTALTLSAVVVGTAGLIPTGAAAEERTCRGTIGDKTLDNVRVPQGAKCVLKGTSVQGTVLVERAAILRAVGVKVTGNVQGEGAQRVAVVRGSRVDGSVQAVQGHAARVRQSRVGGDILYDENAGFVRVVKNHVGGSVQAFQNTGGVRIFGNVIDANLQCKENQPAPIGGENVVQGTKEDQCAQL